MEETLLEKSRDPSPAPEIRPIVFSETMPATLHKPERVTSHSRTPSDQPGSRYLTGDVQKKRPKSSHPNNNSLASLSMDVPKPKKRPGMSLEAQLVAANRSKKSNTWSHPDQAETAQITPTKRMSDRRKNVLQIDVEWIGQVKSLSLAIDSLSFRQLQIEVAKRFKIDLEFVSSICMDLTIEWFSQGSVVPITDDNVDLILQERISHLHIAMIDAF